MSLGSKVDESKAQRIGATRRMRLGQTCLFIFAVAAIDALISIFCGRFPALIYLLASVAGYYRGGGLVKKLKQGTYVPVL